MQTEFKNLPEGKYLAEVGELPYVLHSPKNSPVKTFSFSISSIGQSLSPILLNSRFRKDSLSIKDAYCRYGSFFFALRKIFEICLHFLKNAI